MNKLVFANLAHRPIRSLITVIAIALEVTLILVIVGLSLGILNDTRSRQAGIGADILVQPPGSSNLLAASGAPVSIKVADKLRQMPHVAAVSPVVTQFVTSGNVEIIYGIELDSYEKLGQPFEFHSGGPFTGPFDMIVDDYFASAQNVKVGDELEVLNHKFRVSGIVEHGKGARKFLPIGTLQELVGAQGKASVFYVKLDDPKQDEAVRKQITTTPGMETFKVSTIAQYLSMLSPGNIPAFTTFINVVIGVAAAIGFIVIFQSMYTAVMERTREIGILKSLGASKFYIVNVVLRESLLLAVLGVLLGIAISYAAKAGITANFRTLNVLIEGEWLLRATIIALVGAVLGAIYPAFKAARKDPIDALAYE
jgi:putative ABC transport system permease protein